MQLPSRPLTFAFAMLLSLPCMLRGQASSYLGTESVMQAIDNEAAVLFAAVGPDPSLNLQYDNTVNSDGSFSWSTIAGQTFGGLNFSLSGTGTYDSATTTDNWTASGQIGSLSLSEQGQIVWDLSDPNGSCNISITVGGKTYPKNTQFQVTDVSMNSITDPITDDSVAYISGPASNPDDYLDQDGGGSLKNGTRLTWKKGSGGVMLIKVVPEPSSVALVGLGTLSLLLACVRRRTA